jgi:hypothetical protein
MFHSTWNESLGDAFSYQRLYNYIVNFADTLPKARKDAILKYYQE